MGEQQIEPFAYQKSTNIDEHNQIVDKVNEIVGVINGVELDEVNNKITALQSAVATNTTDIATNASDIDSLADTVDAQATSIATNKNNIESLRDANIIITKDIESIKETDTEQNASITALDNADIATATSEFDNTARKLTITLNPKSGDAITAETIIPASGETGDDYTATAPIAITNKDISLAIDTDTMEITTDGKLKSKASGTDYTAGNGITISDNEIAVDTSVIATTAVTTELASGISTNRNLINGTFDDVNISGSHLVFDKVNGEQKEIEIPSSGGDEWEKVDLDNWPTDWVNSTQLMILFKGLGIGVDVSSWTIKPTSVRLTPFDMLGAINVIMSIPNPGSLVAYNSGTIPLFLLLPNATYLSVASIHSTSKIDSFNNADLLFYIKYGAINGGGAIYDEVAITPSNIKTYVYALYRRVLT